MEMHRARHILKNAKRIPPVSCYNAGLDVFSEISVHIIAGLIHALEPHERRNLDRREAASYLCISVGTLDALVRAGQLPAPVRLGKRCVWDRRALDAAMDQLSGIAPASSFNSELDRELELHEAQHGRH
jgi:predicted DNA-binding transcriptional regulator AlpA